MCLMTSAPSVVPDDPVLEAARTAFLRDGWIDMRALATEAGVGRATLYRRAGSRDQVLAEVLWQLAAESLERSRRTASGRGVDRVVATLHGVMHEIVTAPALRAFLDRDPENALRVLTSRAGGVQDRIVTAVRELVTDELRPPREIDPEALAYAVVRVAESFCYADVLTGQRPDIDTAALIIRRLLSDGA
jgi:AcrR family transcriptional regulator